MRGAKNYSDIIRGAIYGAVISVGFVVALLVPKGHAAYRFGQLVVFAAILGWPLFWRDLYMRPQWLSPLAGRVTLGWIVAIAIGAGLVRQNPLRAYGPGYHPFISLLGWLLGCTILGLLTTALLAIGISAVRYRRARAPVG